MNLLIGIGAAAGGYALAVYTWPAVRAFIVGAEQELALLKARVLAFEAKVRAVLGDGK
jgi:hypothetical protein